MITIVPNTPQHKCKPTKNQMPVQLQVAYAQQPQMTTAVIHSLRYANQAYQPLCNLLTAAEPTLLLGLGLPGPAIPHVAIEVTTCLRQVPLWRTYKTPHGIKTNTKPTKEGFTKALKKTTCITTAT